MSLRENMVPSRDQGHQFDRANGHHLRIRATELFLKAVAVAAGKKAPRGHKLLVLFQRLPEEAKEHVEAEFASMTVAKPGRQQALVSTPEMMNDALEDWRYSCESKKRGPILKPHSALMLVEAIENVCLSLLAARGLKQASSFDLRAPGMSSGAS